MVLGELLEVPLAERVAPLAERVAQEVLAAQVGLPEHSAQAALAVAVAAEKLEHLVVPLGAHHQRQVALGAAEVVARLPDQVVAEEPQLQEVLVAQEVLPAEVGQEALVGVVA